MLLSQPPSVESIDHLQEFAIALKYHQWRNCRSCGAWPFSPSKGRNLPPINAIASPPCLPCIVVVKPRQEAAGSPGVWSLTVTLLLSHRRTEEWKGGPHFPSRICLAGADRREELLLHATAAWSCPAGPLHPSPCCLAKEKCCCPGCFQGGCLAACRCWCSTKEEEKVPPNCCPEPEFCGHLAGAREVWTLKGKLVTLTKSALP